MIKQALFKHSLLCDLMSCTYLTNQIWHLSLTIDDFQQQKGLKVKKLFTTQINCQAKHMVPELLLYYNLNAHATSLLGR